MGLKPAIRELMLGRYSNTDTWSQLAKLAIACDNTLNAACDTSRPMSPTSAPTSDYSDMPSTSDPTPMDLGNVNSSSSRHRSSAPARRRPPPLTPEIRDKCIREGRSFRCREQVHPAFVNVDDSWASASSSSSDHSEND